MLRALPLLVESDINPMQNAKQRFIKYVYLYVLTSSQSNDQTIFEKLGMHVSVIMG